MRPGAAPLLLLLLTAAPALAQPTVAGVFGPDGPEVVIVAHRGNSGRVTPRAFDWALERREGPAARAENSLAALEAAVAAGAHVVEVDVRCTNDDVLVLMHDATIDRTTDGTGEVKDLTWAQLQQVSLLPQGRVPSLEQALRLAAGRCVLDLDLKTDRIDLVVAALQREGATERVLVFDGDAEVLRRVKRLDPSLEVLPRAHDPREARALLADPELRPRVVHLAGPDDLTAPVLAAARAAGVRLWVNALGPKDALGLRALYRALRRRGADVIQTDRPGCVREALRR